MVKERVRTLPTEPTEGEIVKSNPLLSFINIGQRGRMLNLYTSFFVIFLARWLLEIRARILVHIVLHLHVFVVRHEKLSVVLHLHLRYS